MPPTLDVLEDVVRREYDAQERRADSLDTKAGLVLGFAGLLVSLTPETVWAPFALLARLLAASAVLVVLRVFGMAAPRLRVGDLIRVRDAEAAREELLKMLLTACVFAHAAMLAKLWRFHAALRLVGASVATMLVGAAIDTIRR